MVQSQVLDEVESFSYLGSEVGKSSKVVEEVAIRLETAGRVYQMWRKKLFMSQNISQATWLSFYFHRPFRNGTYSFRLECFFSLTYCSCPLSLPSHQLS